MDTYDLIEKAKWKAFEAHKGQLYKGFDYYSYHVLGVLELLEKANCTDDEKIVAILHDVVEDTYITLNDIEKDFGESLALSVEHITRKHAESYDQYLQRVRLDWIACKVKIYDAHFNITECLKDGDLKRAKKYTKALHVLMGGTGNEQP